MFKVETGKRKQNGFSLIELLIVVAIILIIASIAIPNLLRARMSANESAAVANLHAVNTALLSYYSNYGSFPAEFSYLSDGGGGAGCPTNPSPTGACLIDRSVTTATTPPGKNGYVMTYTFIPDSGTYTLTNQPATQGVTGVRNFYTDESGVIRSRPGAPATATDPAI
jgi:type IV pilus assembly protein PilA